MCTVPGLILRFVCSLALVLSALPIRAGIVCVAGDQVVAHCQRSCCPAASKARCEVAYRKPGTILAPLKAKNVSQPPLIGVRAADVSCSIEPLTPESPARTSLADAPVFTRPRPPDRGRAPPFPSRLPSSTTR